MEKSIGSVCSPEFCCFLVLHIIACAYFLIYSEVIAPYSTGKRRNIDILIINYTIPSRQKLVIVGFRDNNHFLVEPLNREDSCEVERVFVKIDEEY